jgi:hypothetical protein
MKLTYKVLWYEDQFEHVDAAIRNLERFIRDHGFIFEIERRTGVDADEINKLADSLYAYNPYDMIIFDYDLGSRSENGLSIAKKLRSKIYTDLIFYSGKVPKELRKMLYEEDIDGVFVVGRDTDFYDDMKLIVEDHIKRMSDINNIRGVSMSAVSQIERSLRESIINHLGKEEKSKIMEYVKSKISKELDEQKEKITTTTDIREIIDDPLMTRFQLVRVAYVKCLEGDERVTIVCDGSIVHNVQKERNNLAHNRDEYTGDGKMVLHGPKGNKKEYNFDEFKRLRNELLSAIESINKLNS